MRCASAMLMLLVLCVAGCKKKELPPPAPTTNAVAGSIRVPDGFDLFGVMVYVEGTGHVAFTDTDGRFIISNLPAGTYKFRATRADVVSAELGTVTISQADLLRPAPVYTLDALLLRSNAATIQEAARVAIEGLSGTIRGTTTLAQGRDHSGILVELASTDYRTVTDRAGSWVMRGIPPGSYNLRMSKDGYTAFDLSTEITGGKETTIEPVTLTMDAPAEEIRTVYGSVLMTDIDGAPLFDFQGVTVYLEGSGRSVAPDAKGNFEFTNIRPGRYTLTAAAEDFQIFETIPVDVNDVLAFEGTLLLRAAEYMDEGYATVHGRIILEDDGDNASGVAVALAGTNIVAFTDADGMYVLNNVPLGSYQINATFVGYLPGRLVGVEIESAGEYDVADLVLELRVERPRVVFTSPRDNQRGVSIDDPTIVTIQFSKPMDPGSFNSSTVTITPPVAFQIVTGSGTGGREGLSLLRLELAGHSRSGKPLKYNTQYTIGVDSSVRDLDGVTMEDAFALRFRTAGPMIVDTFPQDGARDIFPYFDLPVKVYFNAPIDPSSLDISDVRVSPSTGALTNVRIKNDSRTGWSTLFIDGRFDYDEEYTITIRRGVRSVTRDNVENVPYSFKFRTPKPIEGNEYFMGVDGSTTGRVRNERDRR
jgi:hypothetical protein